MNKNKKLVVWVTVGLVSCLALSGLIYVLTSEEIKNPVAYLQKQEVRREALDKELTQFRAETKTISERVSKLDIERGGEGRYKELQKADVQELEKIVSELNSIEESFSFTFKDNEVAEWKKKRNDKIKEYNAKLEAIEKTTDEVVAKQKEELAEKVKQEEDKKALKERMLKAYENSGFNIPQNEDGLKITVVSKESKATDDTGKKASFGNAFQKYTLKIENTDTKERTVTSKMFLANYSHNYDKPSTDTHFTDTFNLNKETLVLKVGEEKTVHVTIESLDPSKYPDYAHENLIYVGNGETNAYSNDFFPIMQFKVK